MDYWKKLVDPTKEMMDLIEWNIPEQKTGSVAVIGGNSQNFVTEVRTAEFLNSVPIQSVRVLLPDSLRDKIPPIPGIDFAPSTESGSFAKSMMLEDYISAANFTIIPGDVSKNSETAVAIVEAIKKNSPSLEDESKTDKPIIITRDAVDLVAEDIDSFIERQNLTIVASMIQMQKIFRSVLYPKMIMLSQPIMPIVETFHKFTITYPGLTILTFHSNQILIAHNGEVITIPIDHTSYTPLSLWAGTLASKIAALQLWNPGKEITATSAAVFWDGRVNNKGW